MNSNESEKRNLDEEKPILKNKLKKWIDIADLMKNDQPLRIITLLLIYGKLSLSELSRKMKRTKATLSHHIKKLKNIEIIKTTKVDVRGSIDANVYELTDDVNKLLSFNFRDLMNKTNRYNEEYIHLNIEKDVRLFEVLKLLIDRASIFYEDLDDIQLSKEHNDKFKFREFYMNNLIEYDLKLISEKAHLKIKNLYNEFISKLDRIMEEESKENDFKRPFLLVRLLFPIENLMEYDHKDTKLSSFLSILEKE